MALERYGPFIKSLGIRLNKWPLKKFDKCYVILDCCCFIVELWRPEGPPSGAPYLYREEKKRNP